MGSRNLRSSQRNQPPPPPSKRIRAGASSSNVLEIYKDDTFEKKYNEEFKDRSVVHGRPVIFSEFDGEFPLRSLFAAIGWEQFLAMDCPSYHSIIKLFYTHMDISNIGIITSYIFSKNCMINVPFIRSMLNLPSDGIIATYESMAWAAFPNFDPLAAVRQITGNNSLVTSTLPVKKDLTLIAKLLHTIIGYNILPRGGSRDYVSYLDVLVMWAILNGQKIDLAHLIFNHMRACQSKKNSVLPYGMVLTYFFQSIEIDLTLCTDPHNTTRTDKFGISNLKLMHYYKNEDTGIWEYNPRSSRSQSHQAPPNPQLLEEDAIRTMEQGEGSHGNQEDTYMDQGLSSPYSPEGGAYESYFERFMVRFDQLSTQIDTRFDNFTTHMDNRFDQVDSRYDNVNTRMDSLETQLGNLLSRYPPPPPPPPPDSFS